jgi:hypothetical protein
VDFKLYNDELELFGDLLKYTMIVIFLLVTGHLIEENIDMRRHKKLE